MRTGRVDPAGPFRFLDTPPTSDCHLAYRHFAVMGIRSTLRRFKRDRLSLHGRTPCAAKFPHLYLASLSLVCVVERTWSLHLLVRPEDWLWGHESDARAVHVGAGPLFLFTLDREPPIDSATSERTLTG